MQILSNPIYATCTQIAEIFSSFRKLGSMNTMVTSDFRLEVEIGCYTHAQWKMCNIALIYSRIAEISALWRKSGSRNTVVTSNCRPEVEIWPFHACTMHSAIITGTVRSLWTWLWGRYHIPRNVFLYLLLFCLCARRIHVLTIVIIIFIIICRRFVFAYCRQKNATSVDLSIMYAIS